MAHEYLTEAAVRNPQDPTAWSELIVCAVGMGLGVDEAQRRFREAVARYPWHRGAHAGLFMQLCQKWGGSDELMHRFAEETAATAPPGAPTSPSGRREERNRSRSPSASESRSPKI